MSIDTLSIVNNDQRVFALRQFIEEHPYFELQDLYKWLYYGEFGYEEHISYLKKEKGHQELHKILEDIKYEQNMENLSDLIWKPMGLSQRFVMVFVTQYYKELCPLNRLVNLIERSPAFQGTRMHFKLDWSFVKDYVIRTQTHRFTKQDFYGFEDRINFHSLPLVSFTGTFMNKNPERYRVVPRKLFFDFFPEFNDNHDILPTRAGDSLID
ncbi:MAG TPA: hypothetical protein PK079_14740 [Leptospiraceae bacterium]|nr:hypothetical protein [Leptospiraceae bacterium]HMW05677.1 hypothetical protein [Leptospiraceae bacterium]HMX33505.1 hypothetical protein [Leptospiraceae bacterium]HMY30290.1 hypothetical protein [Leptospiraceae bacterium]HMZ63643.1 hypothetical protein [Leptospiraceae bacterium]